MTNVVSTRRRPTRDELAAATVLAGVVYLLGNDPQIRAMLDNNDRDRFIEGCRSDPQFAVKFGRALLTIKEHVEAT